MVVARDGGVARLRPLSSRSSTIKAARHEESLVLPTAFLPPRHALPPPRPSPPAHDRGHGRPRTQSTFTVNSTADGGGDSLRQAIIDSNNTPATPARSNVINFRGFVNVAQIQLRSALPAITQPVIIDGTTEGSGSGTHPFVQLISKDAGGPAIGLGITASGAQVKGLALDGFNGGVLTDNVRLHGHDDPGHVAQRLRGRWLRRRGRYQRRKPQGPLFRDAGVTGTSTYTWAGKTAEIRALQIAANTGRIAATWHSNTAFSSNLNLTDGKAHKVSLYAVDWDGTIRNEHVLILDAATGIVLDTETLGSFRGGVPDSEERWADRLEAGRSPSRRLRPSPPPAGRRLRRPSGRRITGRREPHRTSTRSR
jgi:hypothetical protein